jgi:hypothetical protein
MPGLVRRFREAAQAEREAAEQALKPQGCSRCGGVFADAAAFAVHHDGRWPGDCLPEGGLGQLVSVDGVWAEAWRYPGRPVL